MNLLAAFLGLALFGSPPLDPSSVVLAGHEDEYTAFRNAAGVTWSFVDLEGKAIPGFTVNAVAAVASSTAGTGLGTGPIDFESSLATWDGRPRAHVGADDDNPLQYYVPHFSMAADDEAHRGAFEFLSIPARTPLQITDGRRILNLYSNRFVDMVRSEGSARVMLVRTSTDGRATGAGSQYRKNAGMTLGGFHGSETDEEFGVLFNDGTFKPLGAVQAALREWGLGQLKRMDGDLITVEFWKGSNRGFLGLISLTNLVHLNSLSIGDLDKNKCWQMIRDALVKDPATTLPNGSGPPWVLSKAEPFVGRSYRVWDKEGARVAIFDRILGLRTSFFEDVCYFSPNGYPTPYRLNGKWSFFDEDEDRVPDYNLGTAPYGLFKNSSGFEQATAFGAGVACVKIKRGWRWINRYGSRIVNPDDRRPDSESTPTGDILKLGPITEFDTEGPGSGTVRVGYGLALFEAGVGLIKTECNASDNLKIQLMTLHTGSWQDIGRFSGPFAPAIGNSATGSVDLFTIDGRKVSQ